MRKPVFRVAPAGMTHEKTCLQSCSSRYDSNRSTLLQKLAKVFAFPIKQLLNVFILAANNKDADQTTWMCRLICVFVVCIYGINRFSHHRAEMKILKF